MYESSGDADDGDTTAAAAAAAAANVDARKGF
jgi:hypothetical protein